VQKIEITTFISFMKEIDIYDLLANNVVFRGQGVQGNLVPSIARKDLQADTTDLEKRSLQQLKLQGASILSGANETDLDLLVRAQHHGLMTRLLDWTSNPLVALWFACTDRCEGDVYVYAFIADKFMDENVYDGSPFLKKKTRVFQPRMNNPRIISQHGWFTLHIHSQKNKRFIPLENNREIKNFLHEYRIPEKRRSEFIVSLDRLGVNAKTVFPDIGGLCQHLNWQMSLA
jgi:hypothetical protein